MPISVSKSLWKPWIGNAVAAFNNQFPTLSWGTYPGHEPTEDRATDGMVPAWNTAAGKAFGWVVALWLWANRKRFNIWYIIFYGKIISETRPEQGWIRYFAADDPNPSKSHKNHIHVGFYANDPGGLTPAAGPVLTNWDGKSFPGAQYFYIGAQGAYITWLGERLVKHGWTGYLVGPGAEFHPNDQKGVKWFQEKQGWTGSDADGIPGPQTWALLATDPVVTPPVVPPVTEPPPVALPTYKVKAGDTLTGIAARIGTTWQALAELNPGINPNRIAVGQVLNVPKTVPPVVNPPTSNPKPEPTPEVPVSVTETVMGWNILRRTDTEPGRKRWGTRKPLIGKHLRSAKASVYLLIETDTTTRRDCAAELGNNFAYWGFKYHAVMWDQRVWERVGNATNELALGENRFLLSIPLRHKESGKVITFDVSHLENDGDPTTDGHSARFSETTKIAAHAKSGNRVGFFDCNSSTPATAGKTTRERQKPRVILAAAGARFLSQIKEKVTNSAYASHHGGKGSSPKGAWIDDAWVMGDVQLVDGELVRTDGTDASDHHALKFRIKF